MSIYQSNWNPRGVRKHWDRTSIPNDNATVLFGEWIKGNVIDACAWFDEWDSLRVIVADTDAGKRVTYRRSTRGYTIKSEPRP
ncbi:MAG: hypothetical protein WA973_06270 [Mesorhizobium sp.]